jgi:hypothetical protein
MWTTLFTGRNNTQDNNDRGKVSETMTGKYGRIERVWDIYPYPSKTEVDIVLADITSVTMATASPEIKNAKFYEDSEAPLLWYFTQCSIADQRDILVNTILRRTIFQHQAGRKFRPRKTGRETSAPRTPPRWR